MQFTSTRARDDSGETAKTIHDVLQVACSAAAVFLVARVLRFKLAASWEIVANRRAGVVQMKRSVKQAGRRE